MNAFEIVRDFEKALCDYTGAPCAVAVNSCTNALFLALKYHQIHGMDITIPKKTYLSVPMQIIHAGGYPKYENLKWKGMYRLKPTYIYDSARLFTSKMYYDVFEEIAMANPSLMVEERQLPFICVSFHWSKTLGIQQGGAILHANINADEWFRRARFDGRKEGVAPKDDNPILGYHMYMSPEIAAEGLVRLMHLPKHNKPLPNDDYPDLSKIKVLNPGKVK